MKEEQKVMVRRLSSLFIVSIIILFFLFWSILANFWVFFVSLFVLELILLFGMINQGKKIKGNSSYKFKE